MVQKDFKGIIFTTPEKFNPNSIPNGAIVFVEGDEGGAGIRSTTLVVGFTDDCDYSVSGSNAPDVAINTALDRLRDINGGELTLREGTYSTAGEILCPANVTIRGMGDSTIIKRNYNINSDNGMIRVSGTNCVIKDLCIDGNNLGDRRNHGILVDENGSGVADNVTLKNHAGSGVYGNTYKVMYVHNSRFIQISDVGVIFSGYDGTISNNSFSNCSYAIRSNAGKNAYYGIVEGNNITTCGKGIFLSSGGYVSINANNVNNCDEAIEISDSHSNSINANIITDCGNGIHLRGVDATSISGGNTIFAYGDFGIKLESSSRCSVHGNHIAAYSHIEDDGYDNIIGENALFER